MITPTLENQLLLSSLLCGLVPSKPIYRRQLFLVANKEFNSKSHMNDFQKTIEIGVDVKNIWDNYIKKGSGEYTFTKYGYEYAVQLFPGIISKYVPIRKSEFKCTLEGSVNNKRITIDSRRGKTITRINNTVIHSPIKAIISLMSDLGIALPQGGDSSVHILYNFAIDEDFEINLT